MIRFATVLLALLAASIPLPPWWIERWYSGALYPWVQANVTPLTNRASWALLDVAVMAILAWGLFWLASRVRAGGWLHAFGAALKALLVLVAGLYLCFLVMWGLNYRRLPLQEKLEYSESRITPAAARALARQAVDRLNALHPSSRELSPAGRDLAKAFEEAQRLLGQRRSAVTGVPKHSALEFYFRRAAIDGMTNPFFLEIILNPDVLGVERPAVLAHEWAHLAGFANEAEANFVSWLTCMRGDEAAQYSGWLSLYGEALAAVPRSERGAIAAALASGPREDLAAVGARYRASSPTVRAAARDAYDAYLRANRVDEGIGSYEAVVQLILGTEFDSGWTPRLR